MDQYYGDLNFSHKQAYDAGPTYDAVGALECYRIYYKGPLLVGIELGVQGWGGALTQTADIARILAADVSDGNAGIFIWSYNKVTTGSPTVAATIAQASSALSKPTPPVIPPPPPIPATSPFSLVCPNCSKHLSGTIAYK